MRVTIAVANQKGGVGKTTTAINLGSALARRRQRVLLVDLDPQANATSGLGVGKDEALSVYRVLLEAARFDAIVRPTTVDNLEIAGSSAAMASAEMELVARIDRESLLRSALDAADSAYDAVLIDCPPSLGLLTVNALAAASHVLIPLQCEYFALEGLAQLLRAVDLVRERLNPDLRVLGLLMTMEDRRNRLTGEVISDVRRHFPREILRSRIPRAVRLAEAPSHGEPVDRYEPSSRAARAYDDLAREVLARLRAESRQTQSLAAVAHG